MRERILKVLDFFIFFILFPLRLVHGLMNVGHFQCTPSSRSLEDQETCTLLSISTFIDLYLLPTMLGAYKPLPERYGFWLARIKPK